MVLLTVGELQLLVALSGLAGAGLTLTALGLARTGWFRLRPLRVKGTPTEPD